MTYKEAIEYLYHLRTFGMKLGLDKVRRLMDRAGAPDRALKFIHVAGTNGKGSVCAFLNRGLQSMGFKVGMFTSPHLIHFGERIQINGARLSPEGTIKWTNKIREIIEAPDFEDEPPTFFEAVTVMAALCFQEAKCDWVVWETGLGGRLDSTNIVQPHAVILTHIDMDHQAWLGNTIQDIAKEKAGIIKPGVPVFMTPTQPAASEVARQRAMELSCRFELVDPAPFEHSLAESGKSMKLPGAHQIRNAALAWRVLEALRTDPAWVEESSMQQIGSSQLAGLLAETEWPGRCQLIHGKEGRIFLLDGAHNLSGIETLLDTIRATPGLQNLDVLWFCALKDKEGLSMLQKITEAMPEIREICLVAGEGERASNMQPWIDWIQNRKESLRVRIFSSAEEAVISLQPETRYLVTGSLHFIGNVLEQLNQDEIQPDSPTSESRLGESGLNDYLTV